MTIVILDTNFLIYCVKQKIYFEEQINELVRNAEIVIPKQVRGELERMEKDIEKKYRMQDRDAANLALQLTAKLKEINLKGRYADRGIIEYCRNYNGEILVATLDAALARMLGKTARIIKIRSLKKLIVE